MNAHFKEQVERLSPAQQDELARLAAKRVSRRLALLRQTRSSRSRWYIVAISGAGAVAAFGAFPSARIWILFVSVLALFGEILAVGVRIDAITELLERDLRRAADEGPDDR